MSDSFDIKACRHIHFVGIKGVAMTSLALCFDDLCKETSADYTISGSDVSEDFVTKDQLKKREFEMYEGFHADHIPANCDLVVYTGAHGGKTNPEVMAAAGRGIRTLSHAEALGMLIEDKRVISVCGTGGKSTTSAMIAWILTKAKMNPSFAVGVGNIPGLGITGRYSSASEWFVVEADEYAVDPTSDKRPRFIYQYPEVIVCTNLTYDHPDIYPDFETTKKTFTHFFTLAESVYVNGDCEELKKLFTHMRDSEEIPFESCSVGMTEGADYRLQVQSSNEGSVSFDMTYEGAGERQPFLENPRLTGTLGIPGDHNVRNAALAALACMNDVGVESSVVMEALALFKGTMRRFEDKGILNDCQCFDDYAHTPDEIKATLAALRAWYPNHTCIAAFQPHTYSRTKALFDGFAHAFGDADEVWLLDIFASARESADASVSSDQLAQAIAATGKKVVNLHSVKELSKHMKNTLKHGRVFITLGAGDIYTAYE